MRTLLLGFDSFDPGFFETLAQRGKLRNLVRLAETDCYSVLSVANPAQSEVSWTSIATGLNPGGHGIFDSVHREPGSYTPVLSLLPTRRNWLNQLEFVAPFCSCTIFDEAIRQGFPATALWWPALFPARRHSPVRSIPGLGTPDINGHPGVGVIYCDEDSSESKRETKVVKLQPVAKHVFKAEFVGPRRQTRNGQAECVLPLRLEKTGDRSARLTVGPVTVDLQEGVWSAIIQIPFKLGRWLTLPALTRVILSQTSPVLKLYFLPLQQHPLRSPFPYGTPRSFLKETWKTCGPFLTLGWPHEATGLEEGCITDGQFLDLCDLIFEERRRILLHQLESFEEGLIGAVLDTLDRVQHMFWRDRPDVVENWYLKLDALLGEIQSRLDQSTRTGRKANLLVVSSHGFSSFDYKVHLNRWLLEGGYLVPSADLEAGDLSQVNWNWTRSYAVGLNSLYLNLAGRERDGVVLPSEKDQLVRQLTQALLRWQGPDGRKVVSRVWDRQGAFQGTYSPSSPDLVIGFNPGYRASAETGLGRWEPVDIEPNRAHWGADHCFAPDRVPGVVFSSSGLAGIRNPSYKDIPMLAIGKMPEGSVKPPSAPRPRMRDEEDLEERLRSLEYL